MLTDVLIILAGVAIMLFLGEVIIRSVVDWAIHFRLSGSFIGLTILSVGTSIPEIMTHIVGSVNILQQPENINTISGLLIGTNIGSDIFQQNFLLPLVGLIGTVVVSRGRLHAEIGVMTATAVLAWFFCLGGVVSRLEGCLLVLAYVGYILYLLKSDHYIRKETEGVKKTRFPVWLSSALIIVCFFIMAVVTDQVVAAATEVIDILPISASFFGVVFLGIATSLPELSTALVSILRGHRGISIGILIGSNITNPLVGIGLGALISTYTVPDVIVFYDLPVNIFTAGILYLFLLFREDLNRMEAMALFLMFFAYVYARQVFFPIDFPV